MPRPAFPNLFLLLIAFTSIGFTLSQTFLLVSDLEFNNFRCLGILNSNPVADMHTRRLVTDPLFMLFAQPLTRKVEIELHTKSGSNPFLKLNSQTSPRPLICLTAMQLYILI